MYELTISLDNGCKKPLYEQIYEHIRDEIQKGMIRAGEKLPSSRALSRYLGISRSTADLAYGQLLAEGYIVSRPCRGYYVCELDQLYQVPDPMVGQEVEKECPPEWDYDFTPNGIDRDGFPYHMWSKISREVLDGDDGTLFQLGDSQGQEGLRRAVAAYLHHARGVNCRPDQVIIGAGNDYLLLLLHVILGMDWRIAMDDPTYLSACLDFQKMGYEVIPLEPDGQGMNPQLLEESGANLAYVMPSHQFPLGSVMPIQRRQQLLAWADAAGDRFLIEDDYDSEFRYRGRPIPSLQGYDSKGKVIYLGTFSKSLAPAIRVSYMVLPEQLLKSYEERGKNFSVTVSRVDQKILEVFLKDGYFERHLNRMRGVYRNKRDCLLAELKEMRDICAVSGEHAGVHVLVELKNGMSEREAVTAAANAGVKVYGLSEYRIRPELAEKGHPTVIMGYATLSEENIQEAAARLKQAWLPAADSPTIENR